MKRSTIKWALFSLTGIVAASAQANQSLADDLKLIEDLPIEQRIVVHEQIMNFFIANPSLAKNADIIAVDSIGGVYVLDENQVSPGGGGNPSCGSSI